jgi:outer membrane immunogenic protein
LAYGRVDQSGNIHRSAIIVNFDIPASSKTWRTGWTLGGGAEYAVTNRLSVKGEYLYYDLGSTTLGGVETPPPIILRQAASYAFKTRGNIVRLGLNLKIN